LEVGISYNRMLCNDFTGPARFRLNMPEVALELKRVWHPWSSIWQFVSVVVEIHISIFVCGCFWIERWVLQRCILIFFQPVFADSRSWSNEFAGFRRIIKCSY